MKNNNQKHSVGKTIKALRENKRLTQVQLAEKINVSDKAVSKWERMGATPILIPYARWQIFSTLHLTIL